MERLRAVAGGRHGLYDLRQRQVGLRDLTQQDRHERLGLRVPGPPVVAVKIEAIQQLGLRGREALPEETGRFATHPTTLPKGTREARRLTR